MNIKGDTMAFYVYDLIFLVLFCLAVFLFLYKNRKNLKRDMKIAYLYKSQWGVNLINYIGGKYKRTLNFLKYPIIIVGYFLMIGIVYLIARTVYLYVRYPVLVTKVIKAPPIAPVIPYFPQIFGLESFFPPFYFTYFLVSLAIVAFVHEFSHGIYMKFNKVRIKSTGIIFLGPILGAFVEQNEKDMEKAPRIAQMSILGAGVFANIVTAGIFFLLWWGFFQISFVPSGATFDQYIMGVVNVTTINSLGGFDISNHSNQGIIDLINKNNIRNDFISEENGNKLNLTTIIVNNQTYFMNIEILKKQLATGSQYLGLYEDYPAIRVGLKGSIIEINGNKINKYSDLVITMKKYKPSDKINIKSRYNNQVFSYDIVLGKNPNNPEKPMIGVGNSNIRLNMADSFAIFKEPFTDYQNVGEFLPFIYFMIFWIFLINLLVGFFNMLPASIFDGGRFFYLTILGITKNEKIAKGAYKWSGIIILAGVILMVLGYLFGITR